MLETQIQTLGREDLLEKEMATHYSILAWKIPWMEEPGSYSPRGCKESETTERVHFHFSLMEAKSSLKIFSYKYWILQGWVSSVTCIVSASSDLFWVLHIYDTYSQIYS